ncbi:MAG: four helix bundle protein [Candidatus Omnitrophota bacterium]|nr:four helix bundle protein [Candidatus Omnitrophota bacterium]
MREVKGVEDLEVYRKLVELHVEIHELSLTFPKFELYELGSQIRRSSNSAPANLAEGWSNRHLNVYLEGVNRAQGELQETRHHLYVAFRKGYLNEPNYTGFKARYDECGKMLKGLERALESKRR